MKPVIVGVVWSKGSTRNLPVTEQYEMIRIAITSDGNLMTTIQSLVRSVHQDHFALFLSSWSKWKELYPISMHSSSISTFNRIG